MKVRQGTYKKNVCTILAVYGDTMWIEIDTKRYLVKTEEVGVTHDV